MLIDSLGNYTLSKFVLNGKRYKGDETKVEGCVGLSISTPVGVVTVEHNPFYKTLEDELAPGLRSINVSKSGIIKCVNSCNQKLSAAAPDNNYSSLINLTYIDSSIQRAEDFLNTLVAVYNETWVKDKNQIAVSTSLFIEERLRVIEYELGDVDSDITSFRSQNLITDVESASNMYMTQANELNNQILALNNELYMSQYVRSYVADEKNNDKLLPAVSGSNTAADKQISDYNSTLLQRNSMVANSSVNNPMVVEMDKSLAAMRAAIIVTMDNDIDALNVQIASLRQNEQASNSRIASTPSRASICSRPRDSRK